MVGRALVLSAGNVGKFEHELSRQLKRWLITLPAGIGLATLRACIKLLLGWLKRCVKMLKEKNNQNHPVCTGWQPFQEISFSRQSCWVSGFDDYFHRTRDLSMNYLEAPTEYDADGRTVFLAGGITDAENWQLELVELLQGIDATILNPRRKEFPADDESAGLQQIEWEHRHLTKADLVAFWFPPQTLCPIALFELGACCESSVPLVVGTSLDYARRFDIFTQLRLRRPEVNVHDSLEKLKLAIMEHPVFKESFR